MPKPTPKRPDEKLTSWDADCFASQISQDDARPNGD